MKKISTFFILFLLIVVSMVFISCSNDRHINGIQDTSFLIKNNGSMCVSYGNYIYYVNGYCGYTNPDGKQNKLNKVKKGGLYRSEYNGSINTNVQEYKLFNIEETKAKTSGRLIPFKYKTETKDKIDTDVVISDEVVGKQIGTSGYKQGGIFIFDDYIYFASPNDEKDKTGAFQTAKTDFFKVKVDGSKFKKIYTTKNDSSDKPYAFYNYKGKIWLVCEDGSDIVSVRCDNNKKYTLAENVTSCILPHDDYYYKGINTNTIYNRIFYTKDLDFDDPSNSGNATYMIAPDGTNGFNEDRHAIVIIKNNYTIELNSVRDGLLYYYETDASEIKQLKYDNLMGINFLTNDNNSQLSTDNIYLKGDITINNVEGLIQPKHMNGKVKTISGLVSKITYTNVYAFRTSYYSDIIYYIANDGNNYIYNTNTSDKETVLTDKNSTFLFVSDGYTYFSSSKWLFKIKLNLNGEKGEELGLSSKSITTDGLSTTLVDGYVYYFGVTDNGESYYTLVRNADTQNNYAEYLIGEVVSSS